MDISIQAIIDHVGSGKSSLRLTLGGDAYRDVRASLVERLEALDEQKNVVSSSEKK